MHAATPYLQAALSLLKTPTPRLAEAPVLQALAAIRGEVPGSQGELPFTQEKASPPKTIEEIYRELADAPRLPPMDQARADQFIAWGKEAGVEIWPYSCACGQKDKKRELHLAHTRDCPEAQKKPRGKCWFCPCGKAFEAGEETKRKRHTARCKRFKEKREEEDLGDGPEPEHERCDECGWFSRNDPDFHRHGCSHLTKADCVRCQESTSKASMKEIDGGLVCPSCLEDAATASPSVAETVNQVFEAAGEDQIKEALGTATTETTAPKVPDFPVRCGLCSEPLSESIEEHFPKCPKKGEAKQAIEEFLQGGTATTATPEPEQLEEETSAAALAESATTATEPPSEPRALDEIPSHVQSRYCVAFQQAILTAITGKQDALFPEPCPCCSVPLTDVNLLTHDCPLGAPLLKSHRTALKQLNAEGTWKTGSKKHQHWNLFVRDAVRNEKEKASLSNPEAWNDTAICLDCRQMVHMSEAARHPCPSAKAAKRDERELLAKEKVLATKGPKKDGKETNQVEAELPQAPGSELGEHPAVTSQPEEAKCYYCDVTKTITPEWGFVQQEEQIYWVCPLCQEKIGTKTGEKAWRHLLSGALGRGAKGKPLSILKVVLCPGCRALVTEAGIAEHACAWATGVRAEYHESGARKSYKTLIKEGKEQAEKAFSLSPEEEASLARFEEYKAQSHTLADAEARLICDPVWYSWGDACLAQLIGCEESFVKGVRGSPTQWSAYVLCYPDTPGEWACFYAGGEATCCQEMRESSHQIAVHIQKDHLTKPPKKTRKKKAKPEEAQANEG